MPISSAVSIGTGGPFGAEGHIIMTGGAFGSLFAQFFHLSNGERKTLLVAGAAAGLPATFGAPVAALLLAIGIGGRGDPHALGVGDDNSAALLNQQMSDPEAIRLGIVKAVIWSIALG